MRLCVKVDQNFRQWALWFGSRIMLAIVIQVNHSPVQRRTPIIKLNSIKHKFSQLKNGFAKVAHFKIKITSPRYYLCFVK